MNPPLPPLDPQPAPLPYRDKDFYDAYKDRIQELEPEDRAAFIRDTRQATREGRPRP